MPHIVIQHIPIDSEWVETLVCLCLNIPNNWWPDFDNGGLNQGHFAVINLNVSSLYYFQLKLEDEPGVHYAMRYDSVLLLYGDKNQPGFSPYCLPSCCPGNPDEEIVQGVRIQKNRWMVDDDYTNKEDIAVDDNNGGDDEDNNGGENDKDNDLYSKVVTNKKRKKGTRSKQTTSKKTKSVTATKCNKNIRHINNTTTINHDYVTSGKGDSIVEGDTEGEDPDSDIDSFDLQRYEKNKRIQLDDAR